MSFPVSAYWSLTYLASAIIALGTAVYVLLRNRKSLLHFLFFVYGVISSSYLFVNFLVRIIVDSEIALQLYRFSNSLYFISIALTLIFIRTLAGKKEHWIIIIPPMLIVTASVFIPYELRWTNFGWKFLAVPTVEGAFVFLYLVSYSMLIILHLYDLRRKAEVPWLRKKYGFMLWGVLVFQMFGLILSNALMLVWSDLIHIGGFLYFFSFMFIWYGFQIQPSREVVLTRMGNPLTDSYQKFLNKLLEVAPPDELGLKTMNLLEYLDKTRLSDVVTYDRLRIILNAEKIENLDSFQALDKTLEYFEGREWTYGAADELTEVLESMYFNLKSPEERETFKTIIMNHQEYLKKTDIIYGLATGEFLAFISFDKSLEGLQEWEAVLRLYRRLLLPVRKLIAGPLAPEFFKKLRSMDVAKHLDVSTDGEIGIERLIAYVRTLPNGRRVEEVRETFNALLSTVSGYLVKENADLFENYLGAARRVFMLNSGAKGVWKTYYTLVDRLSTDIGRSRITRLVRMEDCRAEDLNAFSEDFGLTHDRLIRRKILFEYNPKYLYEPYVAKAVREIYANTERCILLLRPASGILPQIPAVENVKLIPVVTMGAKPGESVSFDDVTQMINAINRSLDSEMHTWIILDVSDMILSTSMEQAYAFARHAIELVSAKDGSAIFMLNEPAHDLSVKTAFEGLFSTILEVAEKPRLLKLV
jgi:hypothetical protein